MRKRKRRKKPIKGLLMKILKTLGSKKRPTSKKLNKRRNKRSRKSKRNPKR